MARVFERKNAFFFARDLNVKVIQLGITNDDGAP